MFAKDIEVWLIIIQSQCLEELVFKYVNLTSQVLFVLSTSFCIYLFNNLNKFYIMKMSGVLNLYFLSKLCSSKNEKEQKI